MPPPPMPYEGDKLNGWDGGMVIFWARGFIRHWGRGQVAGGGGGGELFTDKQGCKRKEYRCFPARENMIHIHTVMHTQISIIKHANIN